MRHSHALRASRCPSIGSTHRPSECAASPSLSASAPLIAVWDDHEVANDPWVGGAQDHNPEEGEGDWWLRKRAA